MKGAIYKCKETGKHIRMYSNSDEQLMKPLDSWELIKIYTDEQEMMEDYSRLQREQSKLEGQIELAYKGGIMKR